MSFDAIGTIQRARQQQLQSLMATRSSNFQYSQPTPQRTQAPSYGFQGQRDTVTLGGRSAAPTYGPRYSQNNGSNFAYSSNYGSQYNANAHSDANARMSNGQTIEDLFNNPYANDPDMAYLKDALDQIAAARAMYGSSPSNGSKKDGQKGDLRVIAGDRSDGVKPKEVRIDDVNNYEYQKAENGYQDRRQEARFKDGTVGREYDVTVTWEDGSTTKKRVTLDRPGQIVYMDSAYSY